MADTRTQKNHETFAWAKGHDSYLEDSQAFVRAGTHHRVLKSVSMQIFLEAYLKDSQAFVSAESHDRYKEYK